MKKIALVLHGSVMASLKCWLRRIQRPTRMLFFFFREGDSPLPVGTTSASQGGPGLQQTGWTWLQRFPRLDFKTGFLGFLTGFLDFESGFFRFSMTFWGNLSTTNHMFSRFFLKCFLWFLFCVEFGWLLGDSQVFKSLKIVLPSRRNANFYNIDICVTWAEHVEKHQPGRH